MARIDLPARKFFIRNLVTVRRSDEGADDPTSIQSAWTCQSSGRTFEIVWIQGTIKQEVQEGSFLLNDNTGTARILLSDWAGSDCPTPTLGRYMMVVGQLMKAGDEPVVKLMKLQDLTDNSALKEIWNYEVQDVS